MHRNTWGKPQGPGVMTIRHFDQRQDEEKPANRRAVSPQKNGLGDPPALAVSSGPGWQLDTSGPSHTSGSRPNGFQPPRFNVGSTQASASEEGYVGARPTERGPHMDTTSLTLSIPSTREQLPTSQTSGFGSPLPTTFLRMLKPSDNSVLGQRALQGPPPQPVFQGGSPQVGLVARSTTQTHLSGRPTAQLTIFYAGTVNVYDDVPADKAQAIMTLAGGGNSWSSNVLSPPVAVGTRPVSTGGVPSSSSASGSTPTTSVPTSSGAGSPLVPAMLVAGGLNKQAGAVGARTILHQELPQARKASLARFLEKRKDRVRGKAPYMTPQTPPPAAGVKKSEGTSPPREKSPSPCTSKVRARSPSPVNTTANQKRSPSPAQRPGPSQSSGSETSSPTQQQQRPRTPQKPTQPTPEEQSAAGATWRRSKDEQAEWGSQQQAQHSKEEKSEPMKEETGSPSQRH